jgi:hypothetical protein
MDQGLPIAFENNAATWQNMPGMAAFYTGRQNQIAEDNIGMLQKAFEAEQAYKAQQRPVELQNLVKSGVLTEAQARHQDALTRASGLTSDKMAATMPGEVASTNAKNQQEVATAQQAESVTKAIHLASWLQGPGKYAPPFMQAQKFMQTYGIEDSPDGAKGRQIIADMPKLIPLLEMEAKKAWQLSGAGQQTLTKEAGDNSRNAATNSTSIAVANIHKDATLGAAAERAKARSLDFETQWRKANSLEKLVLLGQEAQIMDSIGETKKAEEYRQRAQDPVLYKAAQAIASQGGTSTIRRNPDGTISVIPRQEAIDLGGNNSGNTPRKHSLADVQKMYPGVPPEQLKKAYKEKFGVDLQ